MWKRLTGPPDPRLVERALDLGRSGRTPHSIASALKVTPTELASLMARAGYAWDGGGLARDSARLDPPRTLPAQFEARVLRLGGLGLSPEAIARLGALPASAAPLVAPFLAERGLGPGDPKPALAEAHALWLRALPLRRLAEHLKVPAPEIEAAFAAHGLELRLPPEAEAEARALVASGVTKREAARRLGVREALVYALPDAGAAGGGRAAAGRRTSAGGEADGADDEDPHAAARRVAC